MGTPRSTPNDFRVLDAGITTTAGDVDISAIVPGSLAWFSEVTITAPTNNSDTIHFRINATATTANGESLAPGESRDINDTQVRSVSVIAVSGTQAVEVVGRG